MKKIISAILAALMLICMCGCDMIDNLIEPGSDELVGTKWILWSVVRDGEKMDYNAIRANDDADDDVDFSGEFEFTDTYEGNIKLMGISGKCEYKLLGDQLTIKDGKSEIVTTVEGGNRFSIDAAEILPSMEEEIIMEFALDDGTLMQQLAGELAGTEWVLYSASSAGITLNYNFIDSFGYSGKLNFEEDGTFDIVLALDYNIVIEGAYTYENESSVILYGDDETRKANIEDGILSFEYVDVYETTTELSFVPADSELLAAALETSFDENYSGGLANTVWPLYYLETEGVKIDGEMIEMLGVTGSINFGDGTYVLELYGEVIEGDYADHGTYVDLLVEGIELMSLERDGGVLLLDADGAIMAFGYDTEVN